MRPPGCRAAPVKHEMPIYEYECDSCQLVIDVTHHISDMPLIPCPRCQRRMRRIISRIGGFIFKGPGFYATDYGRRR